MTLGEKLKVARESKKLGQKEVSNITGINYKTISNYENNRSEPDVENLAKLCRLYGISADYFINVCIDGISLSNTSLLQEERTHLQKYRQLNADGKEYIDDQLNFALSQEKYKLAKLPHEVEKGCQPETDSPETSKEKMTAKEFHEKMGVPYSIAAYNEPGGHVDNSNADSILKPGPEFERKKEIVKQYHEKHKPGKT